MARIVCIHGIAQQLNGPELQALRWRAALRDGMRLAPGGPGQLPSDADITVAFYGDLFRGRTKSIAGARYELADIEPGFEEDLLQAWADAAGVQPGAGGQTKSAHASRQVQQIAVALLKVPFFARWTDRMLVGALKQVRWYLTEPSTRTIVRERLAALLSAETQVVVAHSLGSVIAYEVLCQSDPGIAPTLITLGSPIGLPGLIFDRLDPAPVGGRGRWPGHTRRWTNIAAPNDIVAAVKRLAPLFAGPLNDVFSENEASAHDLLPYLTAPATGAALRDALIG